MRVLAEEGVLLALGTVLAVMTGIRTDAVFIAGLLLAVSVTGLVEGCMPMNDGRGCLAWRI